MGTPMEPGRLRWVFGALCVVGVLGVSSGAQDRVAERVLAAQLTRISVDAGLCAAPYGAVLRPGGLPVVVEETTPGRAVSPAAARVVATDRAFAVGAGDGARARLRVTELRDGLRILGRWSLRRVSAASQETWDLRNTEGLGAMAVPQVPLLMYLLGAGWMCGMTPARRARIACLIGLLTQALYWLATAVYLAFGQVPATPFSSASGLGVYEWMLRVSGRLSPALAAGILAVALIGVIVNHRRAAARDEPSQGRWSVVALLAWGGGLGMWVDVVARTGMDAPLHDVGVAVGWLCVAIGTWAAWSNPARVEAVATVATGEDG